MPWKVKSDRTPSMLTLQVMLLWSASIHTRNNKGRAAVIIAQTEGQGALAYGL